MADQPRSFKDLFRRELAHIGKVRGPEDPPDGPDPTNPDVAVVGSNELPSRAGVSATEDFGLSGLCLSGGGIRSATFDLGALQGLARLGKLGEFDYLSTVSGGGYAGAWWTAWRLRRVQAKTEDQAKESELGGDVPVFPGAGAPPDGPQIEDSALRHVRFFSGFLFPRVGFFTADFWSAVGTLVAGALPALATAGALLLLVLIAWAVAANGAIHGWFFDDPAVGFAAWNTLLAGAVLVWREIVFYRDDAYVATPQGPGQILRSATALVAALAAVFAASWGLANWVATLPSANEPHYQFPGVPLFVERTDPTAADLPVLSPLDAATRLLMQPGDRPFRADLTALAPAAAWLIAVALLALLRLFWATLGAFRLDVRAIRMATAAKAAVLHRPPPAAAKKEPVRDRTSRNDLWEINRAIGRLLALAAAWAFCGWVWLEAGFLSPTNSVGPAGGAAVTATGLFTLLMNFAGRPSQERGPLMRRVTDSLPSVLACVAIFFFAALLGEGVLKAIEWSQHHPSSWWATNVGVGPVGLLALAGFLVAVVLAPAFFFLDEQRTGLHAFYYERICRAFPGASNPKCATGDGVGLQSQMDPDDDVELAALAENRFRPLHLVCVAANDLSERSVDRLGRGAVSATLSPHGLCIGDRFAPWPEGGSPPAKTPSTLGEAVTISGAAFNSMMGDHSARMGLPTVFLMAALNLRLGRWARHPHGPKGPFGGRLPRGLLFYAELFGRSRAHVGPHACNLRRPLPAYVHLSDGGHFENLGLYELVRRRCRSIVVCDGGADREMVLENIGNALRRVRADFGVEIDIDISKFRPDDEGFIERFSAAGTIRYPPLGGKAGFDGKIVVLKLGLPRHVPADVWQYRKEHPEFPHQSTLDQVYSPDQWESYRKLGEAAAAEAAEAFGP